MAQKNKTSTLDIPQYDANQHYLNSSFDIISAMIEVAKNMDSYDDIRYSTLTEMLLNIIIDEEVKQKLISERDNSISNLPKEIGNDERNRLMHSINISMFGKWFGYAKKYMSLETQLKVFHTAPDIVEPGGDHGLE